MSTYESVINSRYKAPALSKMWSYNYKTKLMRQLWIDLAIVQKELGLDYISHEAISELIAKRDIIHIENIKEHESRLNHDVMAHIASYAELCPIGGKILHLGATSNFINDNVDAILVKCSFSVIECQLKTLIQLFQTNAEKYSDVPTLAYTHLQSAQLITIGRRFSMWKHDLLVDSNKLSHLRIPFRGMKGTVGTEDTLLKLFNNNPQKCDDLNDKLTKIYQFDERITVCGQTYSRKYDVEYIHTLSTICQSIYKIMNDIRLLSGKMEVYEEFKEHQVGSSAMPYKKNPINCEKICSLCRVVINHEQNMTQTYINQWLERSLDDSAIKRIVFPECFLLTEHILNDAFKVIGHLQFNMKHINKQVENHMVNVVSEEIILKGVQMGYSRQEIHEILRNYLTRERSSPPLNFEDEIIRERPVFLEELLSDNIIGNIINNNNISFNPMNYIGRSIEQCFL